MAGFIKKTLLGSSKPDLRSFGDDAFSEGSETRSIGIQTYFHSKEQFTNSKLQDLMGEVYLIDTSKYAGFDFPFRSIVDQTIFSLVRDSFTKLNDLKMTIYSLIERCGVILSKTNIVGLMKDIEDYTKEVMENPKIYVENLPLFSQLISAVNFEQKPICSIDPVEFMKLKPKISEIPQYFTRGFSSNGRSLSHHPKEPKYLAMAESGEITVRETTKGGIKHECVAKIGWSPCDRPYSSIKWSPDGTKFAVAGCKSTKIIIFSETCEEIVSIPLTHVTELWTIEWTDQSTHLACGYWDGSIKIINTKTSDLSSEFRFFQNSGIETMSFLKSASVLFVGDTSGRLYSVGTANSLLQLQFPGYHERNIVSLALTSKSFIPQEKKTMMSFRRSNDTSKSATNLSEYVITGSLDETVKIMDWSRKECVFHKNLGDWVIGVAFSPHDNFGLAYTLDSMDIFFFFLPNSEKDKPQMIKLKTKLEMVTEKDDFLPQIRNCFVGMVITKSTQSERITHPIGSYEITALSILKGIYTITLPTAELPVVRSKN